MLKNIFNKVMPKFVIMFETNGCMGHIHDYIGIGYIVGSKIKEHNKIYDVKMVNFKGLDFRDKDLGHEKAYNIQHLFANLYIHYK